MSHLPRRTLGAALLAAFVHSSASAWSQFPTLEPNQIIGPSAEEITPPQTWLFGQTVSLREKTAFIGMPATPESPGRVAIFSREHDRWERTGTLLPSDSFPGDSFGLDITGSGERWLFISKHAYRRSGGEWREVGLLQGLGVTAVAAEGDTLFSSGYVGTFSTGYADNNKVKVFKVENDGSLTLTQILSPGADVQDDFSFGASIAVSHDTLVLNRYAKSAVYIFVRHGDQWVEQQKLVGKPQSGFGYGIALDDDILLATGPRPQQCPVGSRGGGALVVFVRVRGVWTERQTIEGDCESMNFAESLALRAGVLAIGMTTYFGTAGFYEQTILYQWNGHEFEPAATAFAQHASEGPVVVSLSDWQLFLSYPYVPNDPSK